LISYEIVFTVALVVSTFLAVHLEESVHAVASFGFMIILLSGLYFSLGAPFAAVFQLAIGVGTLAVFFLAGEMLASKKEPTQRLRGKLLGVLAAVILSLPSIALSVTPNVQINSKGVPFSEALWGLRGLDVAAQGFVILVISMGVAIILKRRRS